MTPNPALQFADSPRYAQIAGIFTLIRQNAPSNKVWTEANRVMQQCNGQERDAMPDLVKAELAKRGY